MTLKPCPFCGSAANTVCDEKGWYAYCVNCIASQGYVPERPEISGHRTEYDAIAAWNRRVEEGDTE